MRHPLYSRLLSLPALVIGIFCSPLSTASEAWMSGVSTGSGWTDVNKTWDTDTNLCWAAATSNIIGWWQNQTASGHIAPLAEPQGAQTVFDLYKNNFTDSGSNSFYGWQWWFSGDYRPSYFSREITEVGKPSLYDQWSQLKGGATGGGYYAGILAPEQLIVVPSGETGFSYYPDYCLYQIIWDNAMALDTLSTNVIGAINGGYGLTISVAGDNLAHAITLWGVEYDDETNNLTKLFITDSDDTYGSNDPQASLVTLSCTYNQEDGNVYISEETAGVYAQRNAYIQGVNGLSTDLILASIPEPASCSLALIGLCVFSFAKRRRN